MSRDVDLAVPAARTEIVRDAYFGVTIEDPYRWLEDAASDEARAWIVAQGAYARAWLDDLPGRAALLQRIAALSDALPVLSQLQVAGGRAFYRLREPGEALPKLVVREAPAAPPRVLLDPNGIQGEVFTAIDWFYPSREGRLVACGLSQGGAENSTLRLIDVDSGAFTALAIPRTDLGSVAWLEGDESFLYQQLQPTRPGAAVKERFLDSVVRLHRLDSDPAHDPVVLGRGLHPAVPLDRADIPVVEVSSDGRRLLGLVLHGTQPEFSLYAAPAEGLANAATCPWVQVARVEDAVVSYAVHGDTIYLLTHREAPCYRVVATSLTAPTLAQPHVAVPETARVIEALRVAGDYLLLRDLDAGIGRLRRLSLDDGAVEEVALPVEGTITEWAGESTSTEVLLELTSWTVAPRLYRYDAALGQIEDTGWLPPPPLDLEMAEVEAHEVLAPAADGTMIPLSIVHKRGLQRDGTHPALVVGYGAYGLVAYPPSFTPALLAWYERGGVYAAAHVRGGGELGRTWHEAGRKLTKENTITDFIACAEYLIREGYTAAGRVAGLGRSAGGILAGGALVRRPDLWAAMLIGVPVVNALRFEEGLVGPANVAELGSVQTEEGFRGLLAMDAYHGVRDGVAYPAVLLTAGLNDARVNAWQPAKMAARLQAASTSGNPVLLRVEEQGGHGGQAVASTKRQADEELADFLAFILAACERSHSTVS